MDDTAEFEQDKRRWAKEMSQDRILLDRARDVLIRADRYNYSYQWSWLGLPIIQLPADIVVTQEIVWNSRPTVIVETGIARGGSLILYASILQLLGVGKVIGIDIDIRAHNRRRIEDHPVSHRIDLIEGSSTDPGVVSQVKSRIAPDDRVMIVCDSDHTHEHVLAELRLFAPLVTAGQYLVVADTVIEDIPPQTHRPRAWGPGNNPKTALQSYLEETNRFERDSDIEAKLLETASPGGYLRCLR